MAAVIPVRNRQHHTLAILQQLQVQSQALAIPLQIIVVDDGSTDGTPALIKAQFPQVHLLAGDGNLWWTGAIAQGMQYAVEQLASDYIVWLNDDITLADDFARKLQQVCQQNYAQKAIIGGIVREQTHLDWVVYGGVLNSQLINSLEQFQDQATLDVHTLNGNIVVMPAQLVRDIGLPDAKRFRHYGGDYEYICRARVKGYKIRLTRELQSTTDFQIADVKRHMPLWLQAYLSPSWASKRQVLQQLTNLKSPQNVQHMVNSIYRDRPTIPRWKYLIFYLRKVTKLLLHEFVPTRIRQQRAVDYLQQHNVPKAIADKILSGQKL
ncbi:MAG: glycosyltransferase family 2 protein [Leptolyngbyaceae cyanobacterium RM1_1_2]|nr:glycosyltransferase family 2 protein [Leptolyngbyaceae cyanobacterium RM1_1_2]